MLTTSLAFDILFRAYLYIATFLIFAMLLDHTFRFYPVPSVPLGVGLPARTAVVATGSARPAPFVIPIEGDGRATVSPLVPASTEESGTGDDGEAIELPSTREGLQRLIEKRGLTESVKVRFGKSYLRCRKDELIAVLAT